LKIQYSAPGRCGIIGNPSDIYGGFLVSCSVPLRNSCTIELADTFDLPDDPTLWNAATARFPTPPVRVTWHSEVPRSSGLAGSTALLAATIAAVLAARGEPPALDTAEDRSRFAELVRDIELNEAGVVCGYQDAYMAVHGGLQTLDFSGKHPIDSGPLGILTSIEAPLPFLLVTTGVERLSGSVHGPIRDRWLAGDREVIDAMARVTELGRSGAEALRKQDWDSLAKAMTENQAIVAALGGSGEAIDALIAQCLRHGAKAAKLAGAGMGGTVIALTEDPTRLRQLLESDGFQRIETPSVTPGLVRHTTPRQNQP